MAAAHNGSSDLASSLTDLMTSLAVIFVLLLVASMNNYKVGMLFAVILLLTVIGFLLYLLIGLLRRLVIPWHESATINERAAKV